MAERKRYVSANALRKALTAKAKVVGMSPEAAQSGFIFERFMARVVQVADDWVLKGGGALLVRVIDTRSTTDLDLVARGSNMADVRRRLEAICSLDLADDFVFVLKTVTAGHELDYDTAVATVVLGVDICGRRQQESLKLDVSYDVLLTQPVEHVRRGDAPRPAGYEAPLIPLYPVVDHVADKVCATAQTYKTGTSTRVRDLVDICVLALTHDIDGRDLAEAIAGEWKHRGLEGPVTFVVPETFTASGYDQYMVEAVVCREHAANLRDGERLAGALMAPVVDGTAADMVWQSAGRRWVARDETRTE
ncbi:nucleotidyl transferase AbiEii/AbiGii toxin family protein [Sanguibacter sp. A247]|uniref:nucleotidyl transferase AbiEii/AbiGii toxin family protein n=1 Tax=unclassified Sanguibacter TaxID=2645534 RepID=UPI003FD6C879